MGVNANTTPNQSVQPNSNYEVVDVDSQQDKKAAAYVQSLILEKERGNIMDNNNNNMSAQEQLAMQQLQQMQQLRRAGQQACAVLMTGLKYGAAFGAGFLGCKLLSSNSGSSKDAESLMGAVSELFK